MPMTTQMTATARASLGLPRLSTFYWQWIKMFQMTYNCNFDDRKCCRDAIVDQKAYNTNQVGGMEVWIEDIVQLTSR